MDFMGIVGIIIGLVFIGLGIALDGFFSSFINMPSFMIVLGGVFASTLATYSWKQFKKIGKLFKIALEKDKINFEASISILINLANIARREGVLALEEEANSIEDNFLRKGIMLVVDGSDPELVKNILETELNFLEERHELGQAMLYSMSSYSPAYGMIGTLIGLINMLKELNEPENLGPSMAVALVTTFYGVLLANLLFTPLAGRLKEKTAREVLFKEMIVEGILSIQAGENPRIIEEKLKAFLPYDIQNKISKGSEGDE